MGSKKIAVILALMALTTIVALQRGGLAQAASNLRIVSPPNGQKITANFVDVRYELLNAGASAASTPTYQLQLDGGSPVQTESTEYTFTGLAPGKHTVLVELVDANGTPVAGSMNAVSFIVASPQPAPGATAPTPAPQTAKPSGRQAGPVVRQVVLQQQSGSTQQELPNTGSALPLLSIIGFGVLLGGIASALKTR